LKKIEIFGLPCSGKTFITNILKNKIKKNNIIHSYSSAFFQFIFYEKNISFLEYVSLRYFKYFHDKKKTNFSNFNKKRNLTKKKIRFRNPLSSYFYSTYLNLCKRYSKRYNSQLKQIIFKKINNNIKRINNDKRNAKLWFTEFFAYLYIVDKYAEKIDFLIDDESIYQKIFIFVNLKKKEKFIKQYINLIERPYLLISIQSKKEKIIYRSKKREGSSKFYYLNLKHLTNMIKYEKKIKKIIKKHDKFITIQNNHNYLKQINNIHEKIRK